MYCSKALMFNQRVQSTRSPDCTACNLHPKPMESNRPLACRMQRLRQLFVRYMINSGHAHPRLLQDIHREFDAAVPYMVSRVLTGYVEEVLTATDTMIISGDIEMDGMDVSDRALLHSSF